MKLPHLLQLAGLAGIGLLVAVGFPRSMSAQNASQQKVVKNVLLVHGAWADGSSWSKVIPRLIEAGLHVVAVQIPLTSLADDVAATEHAIALVHGPVLNRAGIPGGSNT